MTWPEALTTVGIAMALTHAGLLMDDEQFDEINIVRGQPVSGGRLGVKIYPIMHEEQVKK
ncbi:hypothetical protein EGD75_22270 [Escherichia coli]|nr:hypothetical protein [Escherichia coli]